MRHVHAALGPPEGWIDYPGGWPNQIETALLDAVFSANARYGRPRAPGRRPTGVFKVIENWQRQRHLDRLDSLTEMVATAEAISPDRLPDVLDNRQWAPGRQLRKANAVIEAARALRDVGIDGAADLADPNRRERAGAAYQSVPGLGWVTFDYFLSLLGYPNVKADRMLIRFVSDAVGAPVDAHTARRLAVDAAAQMNEDPRRLDHAIWDYQRGTGSGTGVR